MRGGVGQRLAIRIAGAHAQPVRAFLAVPVEEPALSALQGLLDEMRREIHDVRWVRPDGLHLTVHFFGAVGEERAAEACTSVRSAAAMTAPFLTRVEHTGWFDDTVLWCGIGEGAAELTQLALACRSALAAAGFEVESRRYRPHCTFGRSRRPLDDVARHRWQLAGSRLRDVPPFESRRLVLYASHLGPGGTLHEPRTELALGA